MNNGIWLFYSNDDVIFNLSVQDAKRLLSGKEQIFYQWNENADWDYVIVVENFDYCIIGNVDLIEVTLDFNLGDATFITNKQLEKKEKDDFDCVCNDDINNFEEFDYNSKLNATVYKCNLCGGLIYIDSEGLKIE